MGQYVGIDLHRRSTTIVLSKMELAIASVLGTMIDGGVSESVPSPTVVGPTTTLHKIKSKIRCATQPG
jgi:hypothetical protein